MQLTLAPSAGKDKQQNDDRHFDQSQPFMLGGVKAKDAYAFLRQ